MYDSEYSDEPTHQALFRLLVMRVGAAVPRGPTAYAVPPGTDGPACADHIAEELIAVVDLAVLLVIRENLLTEHELVTAVPVFDRHEPRHAGQGDQQTAETVVVQLPVPDFRLHQRPDLLVQHPIILGNQDEVVTQLPVLGEQRHPSVPVFPPEVPAVVDNLALINDNQRLPLFPDLVMFQRIGYQPIRCQLGVIPIDRRGSPLFLRHEILVDGKIRDNAAGTLQAADNILGGVKALAAAGRPRIQPNAHAVTRCQQAQKGVL